MRAKASLILGLGAIALTACGTDPADPPTEQIVIREPGDRALLPTPADTDLTDIVAAGEAAFAVCTGCHVAQAGEASMAGPNLYGVVGRPAAALDDFAYSDALASSGIVWSESEIDAFLAGPSDKVPGTSMVAGAVSDAERRKAIVTYLATLSE